MTRVFRRQLERLRSAEAPRRALSDELRDLRLPPRARARGDPPPDRDPLPCGRVVENETGRHYLVESYRPLDGTHGKVVLGRWSSHEVGVLLDIARLGPVGFRREQVVFLDTETTGVHGGAGMCPFLVGLGYYTDGRFALRQYFIRDFDEEASMLEALADFLGRFDLIVTYNGRAFDLPLVENRCVLARRDPPFGHLVHLDLLYVARRLWKASHGSCRLTALEAGLLRFLRGEDIPGARIPEVWFDYLRHGRTDVMGAVFSHNGYDILSLAALTLLAADRVTRDPAPIEDPRELYSLARIFDRGPERGRSVRLYERALALSLPEDLRVRARERLALLYRRAGQPRRSLSACLNLIGEDAFSFVGYDGAALYHERHSGDFDAARQILDSGIARIRGVPGMERRLARLEARRSRIGDKRQGRRIRRRRDVGAGTR